MKTTSPPTRNSVNHSPLPRRSFSEGGSLITVLLLALGCFWLGPAPNALGVTPAPDGGYPNGNTAEGQNALQSLTSGIHNTALGYQTLFSNTTGHDNMGNGFQALDKNTTGSDNTANGVQALYSNTTGSLNTASGYQALFSNIIGVGNTATGYAALDRNTSNDNTANGYAALAFNSTGFDNTATGAQALNNSTTGDFNTAIGRGALENITTGLNNIALGESAGLNHTLDDGQNIDIGNAGVAGDNRTTRIGASQLRAFIAGIYGVNEGGTILPVYINSNDQLGTVSSSRRFKKEIKAMDRTSEAILGPKPVTFQYKSDPAGAGPQFGLIAEEVAEVNPDLVVRDAEGEIYTVRYDAVNAMLLNEFLKEHRKVKEQETAISQLKSTATKQEATIAQQRRDFQATVAQQQESFEATAAQQQKEIKALNASLKGQASQIQKVSAQLDVIKPAPQVVVNDQ
jgi:hypothetical protein